jgi:hypothetical protein
MEQRDEQKEVRKKAVKSVASKAADERAAAEAALIDAPAHTPEQKARQIAAIAAMEAKVRLPPLRTAREWTSWARVLRLALFPPLCILYTTGLGVFAHRAERVTAAVERAGGERAGAGARVGGESLQRRVPMEDHVPHVCVRLRRHRALLRPVASNPSAAHPTAVRRIHVALAVRSPAQQPPCISPGARP